MLVRPVHHCGGSADNFSSFLSNLKMEEEDNTDINTNSGFRISEEWVKQMAANLHKEELK